MHCFFWVRVISANLIRLYGVSFDYLVRLQYLPFFSTQAPPLIMTTAAAALLDRGGGEGADGSGGGGRFDSIANDSGDNQAVNAAWSTASSTTTAATQIASAIVNRTITKKTDGSQYFYQVKPMLVNYLESIVKLKECETDKLKSSYSLVSNKKS